MDYVIRPIHVRVKLSAKKSILAKRGGGGGPNPPLPVSAPDTRTCTLSYVYTRVCSKFKWNNQQIVKTFKRDGDLVLGGGGGRSNPSTSLTSQTYLVVVRASGLGTSETYFPGMFSSSPVRHISYD